MKTKIVPDKFELLRAVRGSGLDFTRLDLPYTMVLIADGHSEHVAHACRKTGISEKENNRFVTALDLSNALNRSNNRNCYLLAHLFLSYHLI